jgi:hypothetical protein
MHFVLLFLGNATISSYDASFACASLQSNCSKSMMFLFVMLFKLLHLLVLSLMLLLLVIFVKPPSGFYVMFMLLLLVVQWLQVMMFILLVLLSSLVVPSYDVLLACDFHHVPFAFAFM